MAKLFGKMEDERGIEVHKIANRELCANFYYGSREKSLRAVRLCATVTPYADTEKAVFTVDFFTPEGRVIHSHTETYPMPTKVPVEKLVVTI